MAMSRNVSADISPDLESALEEYRESFAYPPTKAQTVRKALRTFLMANGHMETEV